MEHQSAYDESQGEPNLEVLQYLLDNWKPSDISASLRKVTTVIDSDASAGIAVDIPAGAEIVDVVVLCQASVGSGTMQVKTGADSPAVITDAIDCETNHAIDRAASIDDAYNVVGADGIKIFSHASANRGTVTIFYKK